jgi:hypothetical protein
MFREYVGCGLFGRSVICFLAIVWCGELGQLSRYRAHIIGLVVIAVGKPPISRSQFSSSHFLYFHSAPPKKDTQKTIYDMADTQESKALTLTVLGSGTSSSTLFMSQCPARAREQSRADVWDASCPRKLYSPLRHMPLSVIQRDTSGPYHHLSPTTPQLTHHQARWASQ